MPPDSLKPPPTANRQIARAAGVIMVTFIASKLVSWLSSLLLARTFGTTSTLDAFYAANRLPDTLFNLVAGGALASAFIPTFTTLLTRGDPKTAWKLASSIVNLVFLILTTLSVLGAIFAPWVVRNLLGLGPLAPAQQLLTVQLLRIQLLSPIIFGLSGLVMGILNAHQSFLLPALAPVMYPLGIIFGVLVLAPQMGIFGAAWGMVIGAILHLLVQLPGLARLPERQFAWTLGLHVGPVREVLILMGPRLIGVAAVQLNFLVNTVLAMSQPEGSVTAIGLGFALMMMPEAAIAQSIAIASLPTFSAQFARGALEEMRASLAATLRAILILAIPASIGLILLRRPLISFMYEGGKFTSHSTDLVAWALLWYGAGLVGHCVVEIVSRAFYALQDTRTPVGVGVAAMTLNILFSLAFSNWFARAGLPPHGGLALANTLATALETGVLLILMRRRLAGLHGREIARAALPAAAAAAAMAAVLWVWLRLSAGQPAWLMTGAGILLGGAVYSLLLMALNVHEIRQGWNWVFRRLSSRLTSN